MTIPTTEPTVFAAGDTAKWEISLPDYPASDGWGLSYVLVSAAGKITFSAGADGDDHLVNVSATTTAEWSPGYYHWQARISKSGEVFTVRQGSIEIRAGFSSVDNLDARTHAEKMLAAIEAWLERRDPGVAEYEIAGKRMKYIPIPDLLKVRDKYRAEVRAEAGRNIGRRGRVYVRF